MNKVEIALRKLLGDSALALSDTNDDAIASRIEALAAELPDLRKAKADVATLALAAENNEKEQILKDALQSKKITQGSLESLKKSDITWLKEYIATLPENASGVPQDKLDTTKTEEKSSTVALSDDEQKLCKKMGVSEEEYLKAKNEDNEKDED